MRHHRRAEDPDREQHRLRARELRHDRVLRRPPSRGSRRRARRSSRRRSPRRAPRSPPRTAGTRSAAAPRIANARTPVSTPETIRLVPSSRWKPIAAPRNSARSVAIAIASAWIQRMNDVRLENWSRQTSGRLFPLRSRASPTASGSAPPSGSTRRSPRRACSRTATRRDVRREVAGVDVRDARDERGPEERERAEPRAVERLVDGPQPLGKRLAGDHGRGRHRQSLAMAKNRGGRSRRPGDPGARLRYRPGLEPLLKPPRVLPGDRRGQAGRRTQAVGDVLTHRRP